MKIAMSPTREQFPLSAKKPVKKTVSGIIFAIVIVIMLLIVAGIGSSVEKELSGFFFCGTGILSLILMIGCF